MKCRKIRDCLLEYLDKNLPSNKAKKVEEHLASCPACREELQRWHNFSRFLHGAAGIESPAKPWDEFYRELQERINDRAIQFPVLENLVNRIKPYAVLLWERPLAVLIPAGICLWLAGVVLVELIPALGGYATEIALTFINRLGG